MRAKQTEVPTFRVSDGDDRLDKATLMRDNELYRLTTRLYEPNEEDSRLIWQRSSSSETTGQEFR
jgi:hypothetical protein